MQRYIPEYRRAFFEELRAHAGALDIDLRLIFGSPNPHESRRMDAIDIAWGTKVATRYWGTHDRHLVWQPALGEIRGANLVVVEQATRALLTDLLLAMPNAGRRVALWGHGRNHKNDASALGESAKRVLTKRAAWFFAYTAEAARHVELVGFPAERITDVGNASDTAHLSEQMSELASCRAFIRAELGLGHGPVGLLVSGLYAEKRLSFLVEAADHVQRHLPSFELVVAGGGQDEALVRTAAVSRPWLHYVGPTFGMQKAKLMAAADVFLLPGLVGLGALDALSAGLPVVTVAGQGHSPEFAYLKAGVNSLILPSQSTPGEYASAVSELFASPGRLEALSEGARSGLDGLSAAEMAGRFATGLERALHFCSGANRRRSR